MIYFAQNLILRTFNSRIKVNYFRANLNLRAKRANFYQKKHKYSNLRLIKV